MNGGADCETGFTAPEIVPDRYSPARSRALVRGLAVIAVILVVSAAVPALMIQQKKGSLVVELERRLEILSRGRAEVIDTWLSGMTRPASRIVDSDLFRLFATEMDLSGGSISDLAAGGEGTNEESGIPLGLGVPLTAQLPFMEQVLSDFTHNANFLAGSPRSALPAADVRDAARPLLRIRYRSRHRGGAMARRPARHGDHRRAQRMP